MIYFVIVCLTVFLFSSLICLVLIFIQPFFTLFKDDNTHAIQSAHVNPTSRIGGLAIGISLIVSIFLVPSPLQWTYLLFVMSFGPVFFAGLLEDLGYGVSPRARLLAAAVSSALAIVLLQTWVGRSDVPGFDWVLAFPPVAILFTIFATAGVCNAFNLIDGLNGLSAGTGVITAIGLAAISHLSGQTEITSICFILIAALMGFLVFNFPWGKIFLGDAGAYSLGHALAWVSIILMFRVPNLTPWAVVLVFFWPLADTFFAIYRRRRSGRPTDQPDRLHYHQMVMRFLEIQFLGRGRRKVSNPLATLVMLPFISLPTIFGVMFWNAPLQSFMAVLIFGGFFVGSYMLGIRLAGQRYIIHLKNSNVPAE